MSYFTFIAMLFIALAAVCIVLFILACKYYYDEASMRRCAVVICSIVAVVVIAFTGITIGIYMVDAEASGTVYPCMTLSTNGTEGQALSEYVSMQTSGSKTHLVVMYRDTDQNIRFLNVEDIDSRMPLADGQAPYVEEIQYKFLCFTRTEEVCHININ